jgi:hypothetical protein
MTPHFYGYPSREKGFKKAEELFRQNGGKLIVETGCYHEDSQGASTYYLAKLAKECGGLLRSVDLNLKHVQFSEGVLLEAGLSDFACIQCGDSLDWLATIARPIDLLYLDAFDYDVENPPMLGIYSAAELGAALGKMAEHSVILLDDWNWGREEWRKPILTHQLLKHRGWKLELENYQLLYAR